MTREEEQALIARVLAGEQEAFEPLVKAHEKGVYNLALRMMSNEPDALDASQEAFFRAYRALDSFRGDSKFSVWLYRLTNNVCLDMLRKAGRLRQAPLTDEDGEALPLPDERFDPAAMLERKELRRAVWENLAKLSPGFRQILTLRDINGLSYEEIARITGLEQGTVKSRIFRARKKLAACLLRDGNFFGRAPSNTPGRKGGEGDGM